MCWMGRFRRWRRRRPPPQPQPPIVWQHRLDRVGGGDLFRCRVCGYQRRVESARDVVVCPEIGDPHALPSRYAVLLSAPIEVRVPDRPGEYMLVPPGEWRAPFGL